MSAANMGPPRADQPPPDAFDPTRRSVDPVDLAKFERLGERWWDQDGPMKPLHRMNPVRVGWLKQRLCARLGRDPNASAPLSGLAILDVGCGGGLLCEPLARMGARVTGVDPGAENVGVARAHAARMGLSIDYRETTVEALAATGERFDAVCALEVVEHVEGPAEFLAAAARLVASGGVLFASTLNRTMKSYALAIVGAEYVLRWLPRGTHDWRKFLTPAELAQMMTAAGLSIEDKAGFVYDPLSDAWRASARDLDVNYILAAGKDDAERES
jgi:2-polyprenyl-6-hydroxyphenyl methylase/3-demethylubiquinone-9 3-methyltransferase